jgi:hypothetical protein
MPPPTDIRRRMQKELMWLVLGILLVDAAAIGAYALLDMERQGQGTRLAFTAAWVLATLAVVVPRLQRIRRHRTELRRGHR